MPIGRYIEALPAEAEAVLDVETTERADCGGR